MTRFSINRSTSEVVGQESNDRSVPSFDALEVDYSLLQKQRNVVLSIQCRANDEEKESLDGVVSLLESVLDLGICFGRCELDEEGNVRNCK